jgi:hypothetical protein
MAAAEGPSRPPTVVDARSTPQVIHRVWCSKTPARCGEPDVSFLGHRDAATAVQGAQRRLEHWLATRFSPVPSYTRVALRQAEAVAENTNRSRSLLFAALGAAAAAARGSHINLPDALWADPLGLAIFRDRCAG